MISSRRSKSGREASPPKNDKEKSTPEADPREKGERGHQFRYESLPPFLKTAVIEAFLDNLEAFLNSKFDDDEQQGRKKLFDNILNQVRERHPKFLPGLKGIDVRKFDELLSHAFKQGYIRFTYRKHPGLSHALESVVELPHGISVVAGDSIDRFALKGAEELARHLKRLNTDEHTSEPINLGIVSGATIASTIQAAIKANWKDDFGIDPALLKRKIRVLALTTCQTKGDDLACNANILSFQLANKLNEMNKGMAEPYGISASLIVAKEKLFEEDSASQNRDVIKLTEPYRVKDLYHEERHKDPPCKYFSHLDIVLTGVGKRMSTSSGEQTASRGGEKIAQEGSRNSLLSNICAEHGIKPEMTPVGDILFSPINVLGETISLKSGEKEVFLYSAASPAVLMEMVKNKKVVIMLARDPDKVPALFAAIRRYASELIVDESTALELLHYSAIPMQAFDSSL